VLGESLGNGATDTAAAASDHRNFAGQFIRHGLSFLSRMQVKTDACLLAMVPRNGRLWRPSIEQAASGSNLSDNPGGNPGDGGEIR
jgi:hypothetical protein